MNTKIEELINNIRLQIPFESENQAKDFLERYSESDRCALVSAMYIGREHVHYNEVREEDKELLFSGEMDRFWFNNSVSVDEIPRIIYSKRANVKMYFDSFLRCTNASGLNLDKF